MLVASLLTGAAELSTLAVLLILLSHFMYGMPFPDRWLSLLAFVSLGALAFRGLGLIIASVVNSSQESQIIVQLLYFPMLFLSGTTIPITLLPNWVQSIVQFIPLTYVVNGMQSILGRNETIVQNGAGTAALILTTVLATFLAVKLFRWEKEEKIAASGKLWLVAVLAPFLVLGVYQSRNRQSIVQAKLMARQFQRSRTLLIRGARIFVGDGRVIESGAVLIKNGKIEHVYQGDAPDPKDLHAEAVEAAGKTLLPGLIDVHVHLVSPGGFSDSPDAYLASKTMPRALAAYLYSGITTVKSCGDPLNDILAARSLVNSGERLGAQLFAVGPMFTAPGGHGTEYFRYIPEPYRKAAEDQTVRTPATPEEARQQVDALKQAGVDGIKAILEAGQSGFVFPRLNLTILRAIAGEAHAQGLPMVVHTGDATDVADALNAGANGIEHGSSRQEIPAALFAQMKANGVYYDPTLAVWEGFTDLANGSMESLERPLVLQAAPPGLIESSRKFLDSHDGQTMRESVQRYGVDLGIAKRNLVAAWQAGVTLVTGSDAGNPLVLHGPTIEREVELWVDAGLPPAVALQAATYNSARLLDASGRFGLIAPGRDADLLLVDGNPLRDIKQIESIEGVFLKGEHISRTDLFDQQ